MEQSKYMKKITELLNLYFAGETTIEQEQELKQYFASQNIDGEHKAYQQLFETFATEQQEKYPENLPKIRTKPLRKRSVVISIISAAAAACVLFMLTVFPSQTEENYVVINGKRIYDDELALKMANEKIAKISTNLESGLKHLQNLNKIGESLKPLQKIENIQNKVKHTLDKVNIKI
jgi:hypothetical protein